MIPPWWIGPVVTVRIVAVSTAAMRAGSCRRERREAEGERDFEEPEPIPPEAVLPVHESAEDLLVEVEP